MASPTPRNDRLFLLVFAAGMAWVESAVVYYLRILIDRVPGTAAILDQHPDIRAGGSRMRGTGVWRIRYQQTPRAGREEVRET